MAKYNSEKQVMEVLDVNSLENLSPNKTKEFVSMIPDMDRKVAVGMVSCLPTFDIFAMDVIEQLNGTCDRMLSSNDTSQKEAIDAYKIALNCLERMLENQSLSFEEKQMIIEQIIKIAEQIDAKDRENKVFLNQIHKHNIALGIGMGILVLGALALGVAGAAIYINSKKDEDDGDLCIEVDSDLGANAADLEDAPIVLSPDSVSFHIIKGKK